MKVLKTRQIVFKLFSTNVCKFWKSATQSKVTKVTKVMTFSNFADSAETA